MDELNLGGGMGIAYTAGDDPLDVRVMADAIVEIARKECEAAGIPLPRLCVEPGRAIIGPAGVTLYTVGTIKTVDLGNGHNRTFVSVDGGMSDNIRTALYDAEYTVTVANRLSDAEPMLCRVVGKHCESGDIVVKDCWLPGRPGSGRPAGRGRDRGLLPVDGVELQPVASTRSDGGDRRSAQHRAAAGDAGRPPRSRSRGLSRPGAPGSPVVDLAARLVAERSTRIMIKSMSGQIPKNPPRVRMIAIPVPTLPT